MTIEETLYTRLSGFAGLTALVSTRIYPNIKPQNAEQPAVSYRRVTSQRFSAMSVDSGVVKARFQIDCWALTYSEAAAIRDQVRLAMQRWRTTGVQDTFIINDTDLYEDDIKQHRIAMDVEINYTE